MRGRTGGFLTVVALTGSLVRCGTPGAEQAVGSGDGGAAATGAADGGADSGQGAGGGLDAAGGSSASDTDAEAGGGTSHPDAGTDAGPAAPSCAVPCAGSTPICDQGICKTCTDAAGCTADAPVCDTDVDGGLGQCIQVRVMAIELPDAQMADRAHAAYQRDANVWFPQAAKDKGFFTYEVSNDWSQLSTIRPAKGLIVMFVDISPADTALAGANQAAIQAGFQSYMESGGAWFGSHYSAYNDTDASWNWPWYFDEFLGGGLFVMNTWEPVSVKLDVEIPSHPVSQGLGSMFTSAPSEWYSWTNDLRTLPNIQILLSVDPSSFPVGTDPTQSWTSGYYPIAWTNTNYKMMYVNMGHELMDYSTDTATSNAFSSPTQDIMYMNAFKWLGGAQQ